MNQSFNTNQSPSNNSLPQPRFNNNGLNPPPAPKHYSTEHTDQRKHNSKSGIICQICGKTNHSAAVCRHRYDYFTPEEEAPQALTAMNLQDENDPQLYADSGATTHMVNSTGKLKKFIPYGGSDKIFVGNGQSLHISHIGDTTHGKLNLKDILVVPKLKKNLLSISKLVDDINCFVEFNSLGFVVKSKENQDACSVPTTPNVSQWLPTTWTESFDNTSLGHIKVANPNYTATFPNTNEPLSPTPNKVVIIEDLHEPPTSLPENSDNRAPSTLNDLSGKLFVELNISPVKTTESLNTHPMLTRNKLKQNPTLALQIDHATVTEPKTLKFALKHPLWLQAIAEELAALCQNKTWTLVPRPHDANVIGSKWVYKTKYREDGTIDRLKARLVAKGYTQVPGIDFDETFSPVIKPTTIRLVLALATSSKWLIKQLDVRNAFPHGQLKEIAYMEQPPGFTDQNLPDHVCLLHKSLYGLKQAPRAWFECLSLALLELGFTSCKTDPSLFIFHANDINSYFVVGDIGVSPSHIPHLLCDNTTAIYMTRNPVFHARSKHIEIDVHFVREKVSQGLLKATHVPSLQQATDILTKPLGKDLFFLFRHKLGVHSMTRPTLRGAVKIHCPPNVEFEQSQHMNHMQPHESRTNMEKNQHTNSIPH
ncbi:hypothetical protein KPL71_014290 [Citrus sinensis]|uniref:Uncharacterized protein n=1 Tax=Citrus sinensis TaxID=2711 RepID=A0ACB8KAK5_CITSI|nr:hypothetical protein KPL71_014290 [Citrus sinensis]